MSVLFVSIVFIVGRGFVRADSPPAPGLQGLDQVPGLKQVFHNDDATIYQVVADGAVVPAG